MASEDISSIVSFFNDFFTVEYKEKINSLKLSYPDQKSLYVDYRDLEIRDPEIADLFLKKPELIVEGAKEALAELNPYIPGGVKFEPNVRFFNLPSDTFLIEHLSSTNINEAVSFKGVVTRRADVMHKVKLAVYKCAMCQSELRFIVDKDFIPPKKCDECKKLGTMRQVEEKSSFTDIQRAEVQELLERVRGGAPSAHVELLLEDDLVNDIAPGDNVVVTGVMRLKKPMKTRQKQEMVFSRFIEVNSVQSLRRDFEEIEITKEDEARIKEFSRDPNIAEYISKSIAPSIYGHDEVKKALALQLFGGTKGKTMKGGASIRDDIHILLIGDPGLAKSRFLLSVNELAPKSVYVSGKSVSGAGLTVSAEKDELGEGGWTLKAGAIVLASGGSVQIDEFDKIDDEDRASLHEALETQSYHYKTRVMFSDGKEMEIGKLVESRMDKHKDKIIRGHNCLILRDGIDDIELLTTDFNGISTTNPAQISKHTAPEYFIKIELQTGRELFVTPEHPVWVVEDGKITTKEAEKITEKDYTLMPRRLPIKAKPGLQQEFFKLIGYHITDGGYELNRSRKNGINFYNKDSDLMGDYKETIDSLFDVPIYCRTNPATNVMAARVISMPVLNRMRDIHPMLIEKGDKKIIPPEMISAPKKHAAELLRAAFDSDGTFSGHYIGLIGENRIFIEQVQTLLLRFGIHSRISRDRNMFRVTITGKENLDSYFRHIGFLSGKKNEKLGRYLKRKEAYRNNTDIIPNCDKKIFRLLKELKIHEKSIVGYGLHMQKNKGYCFTRKNFITICRKIREKIDEMRSALEKCDKCSYGELIAIRTKLNLSQEDVSSQSGIKRATIGYWEAKRIFPDRYRQAIKTALENKINVEKEFLEMERLAFGDIGFVAVKKVEKIPNNSEKWVYDVTVKPNETFISECTVLHNTISVAKAGIVAKFRSKTAVLAAANPKYGRFDQNKNLAEQFDVPPTLISRFDLIFPIVDILDEEKDSKLAEHILSTHRGEEKDEEGIKLVDRDLLRKYISYARRYVFPKLSRDASDRIREFYVQLRVKGTDVGSVAITPRYLEGLVRLAEANAKLRLSDIVETEDADVAINLLNYVMKQVMTDKETGLLDVDVVTTGKPKSTRDKMQKVDTIREIIREHLKHADSADIEEVIKDAASYEIDEREARTIINDLLRRGELYEKEHGHVRIVR